MLRNVLSFALVSWVSTSQLLAFQTDPDGGECGTVQAMRADAKEAREKAQLQRPYLIAVGGGSGAGKSTIISKIQQAYPKQQITVLPLDNYYRELGHLSAEEQARFNFDEPSALDKQLLFTHIRSLINGDAIDLPYYDYIGHSRITQKSTRLESRDIIILDGIFALSFPEINADLKIFVDVPDDERFVRRLLRDIHLRGRTPQSVVEQYLHTVKPMHAKHIAPTKDLADYVIPWGDGEINKEDSTALNAIYRTINSHLSALHRERQSSL